MKAPGLEERDERVEELAAEKARERLDGEEVVLARAHPAIGVDVQTAAGDDGVDVGMEPEIAGPGVEHQGEAELGAEALGVAAEGEQRLGGGGKEQIVEQAAVAADERAQQCRQGEDDVEVVGGEQAFASSIDPTELGRALAGGAVAVEAGVVEGHLGRALLAAVEMAAEGGGAAAFEIAENAILLGREAMVLSKAPAVGAEDGGDLQARRTRWCVRMHDERCLRVGGRLVGIGGFADLGCDRIERRAGRGDQAGADVEVAGGGADVGVTEQHLDDAQIGAGLEAVGGERVAQSVWRDAFGDAAVGERDPQRGLHSLGTGRLGGDVAGEQEGLLRSLGTVVAAKRMASSTGLSMA